VADSRHGVRLSGLPSIKGLKKQHECQSAKGYYEWDNSCGGECYQVTVPKIQWRWRYCRAKYGDPKGKFQRV
jgi:hypothetical protein